MTTSETQSAHLASHLVSDDRLLSALLDGMDAALFAVDTGGRVTHWNRRAEQLLGWSREQAVGRDGLGGWAVRDADAADVRDQLLGVLRPEAGADARQAQEFPLLRRDGGRVLVRAQTTAVRGADGHPTGVYCAFSEVHAQLDLERNLALSEALLADSSWAVLITDADLRTVAANEQAARALGVTAVDMLGEPLAEFFGPGIEELESALEHTLAGQAPDVPVELWLTLLDDGSDDDGFGVPAPPAGGPRRCLLSGFLRLGTPLTSEPAPLGVAWVFQDVTRSRRVARDAARRAFRDGQLSRAARAAGECQDPMEAAVLHLHYALAGFAEHALLDIAGKAPGLVRIAESPGTFPGAAAPPGVAVRYRPGHPALQALERGVPVRATGGVARSGWAVEHRWPKEAEHALCVVLRSRGRGLGVVTFLRGAGRRPFDRADAAYGEDVALRVAAAVDMGRLAGAC
ncbi:PAS domain-containing protein [Streptomyces litchfieldiae]|uniref:PAS domain-containing protein n=1 Tax=Streptomyces litchfieldiae TaxID=3075543 RepID=A0ABU2MNV2_9ACTN|nr:PAS domain-containing protein [Streptomyces sp. DSM 44938]MDT0343185.1 PAS domain-containing protein [Streptomyces sp. DSM 44938]